jgi:peptide/nickel transport system substrate-binding protein
MHALKTFLFREYRLKHLETIAELTRSFTLAERLVFYILTSALALSALGLLSKANSSFLVEIPRTGGSITEGVVGSPRFINPLLAITDADRDLISLVYSGLLRTAPDGSLSPDLAQSYEATEDGRSYIFTLRGDAVFHDGKPVTADDVVYTIEKAKDPLLKSPKWASWTDVTVEKLDTLRVKLTPKGAYAPFLQNATLGILPKHLWKNITNDQFPFSSNNIDAIGSGPYRIKHVERSKAGVPIAFTLTPFTSYTRDRAHIETLTMRFYSNEDALVNAYRNGEIESISSVSPNIADKLHSEGARIEQTTLLRVFGIFFNQNRAQVLAGKDVRSALSLAIDKERILSEVLHNYGSVINRPVPPGLLPELKKEIATSTDVRLATARTILAKNGWILSTTTNVYEKTVKKQKTVLSFSLATPSTPELKAAAEIVAENWRSLGVAVEVNVFEPGDLNSSVIRPRKYDALLFGEIIGHDLDLYPFWHSSQRNDPGYNIAMYTNLTADKLLDEARYTQHNEERIKKYLAFEAELEKDIPAIFLYSPHFTYVVPERLQGFTIGSIAIPAERFSDITHWYIETDRVWKPIASWLSN